MERYECISNLIKDTSFVLTGHNIKWFAVLAIETLIKNTAASRDQVVYFDDFSTDGTREELEKRGIRVITWDDLTFRRFRRNRLKNDLSVRVDQIVKSACMSIQTKYVCFLDGDTAYFKDAITFLFEKMLDESKGEVPEFFGILRRKCSEVSRFSGLGYNIWQNYLWFDLAAAHEKGIDSNDINDTTDLYLEAGGVVFNELHDTGNVMYNNVMASDIKRVLVSNEFDQSWVEELSKEKSFHLGWLSSSMRNDIAFCGSWEEQAKTIRSLIEENNILVLCKSVGISPELITDELLSHLRKSVPCE